jgi:exosortase O
LNALILGLWLWLYRPVLAYFSILLSHEEFRTNQIVLLAVACLILARWLEGRRQGAPFRLDPGAPPRLVIPALALALGGSALYLAAERFLDIHTLSATLFGLATYGLLGLWLEPRRWLPGLPAALLLVGVLPFGEHLQTFVGYPVRLLTAALVQKGFAAAGVHALGMETILVFENGISQVDIPCSGVKSLWTGGLFLLAATWIEDRPLNLRWLGTALAFGVLLLAANLARVAVLAAVGPVLGWELLAEMLHVPLGVLGFITACAAALVMLRQVGRLGNPAGSRSGDSTSTLSILGGLAGRPTWLSPLLCASLLLLILLYAPRPQPALARPAPERWTFPPGLETEPLPLSPGEMRWITGGGAETAERLRFRFGGLSGSMILVPGATWRAHHRPERCFQVSGLEVKDSSTQLAAPGFPLRSVSLRYGAGQGAGQLLSAAYWYQSATQTTDDAGTRIWSDLSPDRTRWVLVTILFDHPLDPQDPDLQSFYLALHASVAQALGAADATLLP